MNMKIAVAALAAVVALAVPGFAADASFPKPELTAGYRAITLPMSGTSIAFLKKGDRVDVLVTFEAITDKAKEKVTATILQNVIISNIIKPVKLEDKGAVEIIVNPNEGQYAALSLAQGELQLLARGDKDTEMKPMEMASFRKLFR